MMRGYYQDYVQAGNYGWGYPSLIELFFTLFLIVLFVDALLLGFWLWKQINKK